MSNTNYVEIMAKNTVISVSNLYKRFNLEAGFFAPLGRYVYAVNGVSLKIDKNETYGLVGESGCGKTTIARLLVRMYEADEGEISFRTQQGNIEDVRKLNGQGLRRYREKVKYVFQDPARSLNPRMTVFEVLSSGAKWSSAKRDPSTLRGEAAAILEEVGLSAADMERRPAEFSGGQRQRISIARSLMMRPKLLICDEVVSALDVSIQGQILNLLQDLRSRRESSISGISFLFITHDLRLACYFCDRIGVMYQGEIMEEAPARDLWQNHLHPYTELLFSCVQRGDSLHARQSSQATSLEVSGGCSFAARCQYAEKRCLKEKPGIRETNTGHLLRCFR